jgi:hypothetical protein
VTALKERKACSTRRTDPPAFSDNGKYDRPRAAFHWSTIFLETATKLAGGSVPAFLRSYNQ